MQQILSGDKKAIKRNVCGDVDAPNYPELSVQKLWEMVQNDAALREYLPEPPTLHTDELTGELVQRPYVCEKHFLWNVLREMRPDFADKLEKESYDQRQAILASQAKEEKIVMIQP